MGPDKIMNGISEEIPVSLKAIGKAKTPEEKLMYSETINNLCDSLGVFPDLISGIAPFDDEDEPVPF